MREDGRALDEVRAISIELAPLRYAEGSALIAMGQTRVLCAVSVEETVPKWMAGRG